MVWQHRSVIPSEAKSGRGCTMKYPAVLPFALVVSSSVGIQLYGLASILCRFQVVFKLDVGLCTL